MTLWALLVAAILFIVALAAARRSRPLKQSSPFPWSDVANQPPPRAEAKDGQREPDHRNLPRLSEEDRAGFLEVWKSVCERFASEPKTAVVYADLLMADLIQDCGCPSCDASRGVEACLEGSLKAKYRTAHDISDRNRRGSVKPDELKRAMSLYAVLFDRLLAAPSAPAPKKSSASSEAIHHYWA